MVIFILSIAAVSAEGTDNENSLNLNDNMELSENLFLAKNNDFENNPLEDSLDEAIVNSEVAANIHDFGDDGAGDGSDDTGDDTEDPILKNTTLTIVSQDNWKIYGGESYTVQLVDEDNNPIANALINFRIKTPKGTYIYESNFTEDDGIAILHLNLKLRGINSIQVSYDVDCEFNPAESVESNVILHAKTYIQTPRKYAYRSCNFTIKLVSSTGEILSNKKVTIYVDGVKYTKTTDSKGQIYIKMPSDKKSVKLSCSFSASDYCEASSLSMNLPVYKKTCMKSLVYAILKGQCFKVLLKGTDGKILNNEKVKFTIDGKDYYRTTNDKGIAYMKVKLTGNAYRVYFSFDNNGIYGPSSSSSILNVIDPSGQFKKGLNQNTKLSVSKYLTGGGYAKITKSIRQLSKQITGKYKTKLEKATAIYNYVRDNLGYSYYANSKKGAAKTLKTKKGNCCDHSNLIVALCRASKIPARYSHARGCKFGSGVVTGHVWAQIYVGGRWYSADATSYRNSLGHINNWNTKSYRFKGNYRNIPF